uniref:GPI ethanolamine phosphate transferase 2 n=1 Tax=Schistocephalus solidus TaxID=70667 RepID=A0A183TFY8_SCHSO
LTEAAALARTEVSHLQSHNLSSYKPTLRELRDICVRFLAFSHSVEFYLVPSKADRELPSIADMDLVTLEQMTQRWLNLLVTLVNFSEELKQEVAVWKAELAGTFTEGQKKQRLMSSISWWHDVLQTISDLHPPGHPNSKPLADLVAQIASIGFRTPVERPPCGSEPPPSLPSSSEIVENSAWVGYVLGLILTLSSYLCSVGVHFSGASFKMTNFYPPFCAHYIPFQFAAQATLTTVSLLVIIRDLGCLFRLARLGTERPIDGIVWCQRLTSEDEACTSLSGPVERRLFAAEFRDLASSHATPIEQASVPNARRDSEAHRQQQQQSFCDPAPSRVSPASHRRQFPSFSCRGWRLLVVLGFLSSAYFYWRLSRMDCPLNFFDMTLSLPGLTIGHLETFFADFLNNGQPPV